MNKLKELIEKRNQVIHNCKKLKDKESLTAEERDNFDALLTEAEGYEKEIRQLQKLEEMETREFEIPTPGDQGEERSNDEQQRDAFCNAIAGNPYEKRDVNVSEDTKGGLLVPNNMEKEIRTGIIEDNFFRNLATVSQAASRGEIPVDFDGVNGFDWIDEKGNYPEIDQDFDAESFKAKKLGGVIWLSDESIQDIPNIESYLKRRIIEGVKKTEEKGFLVGTGVGQQPKGIFTDALVGYTCPSTLAITQDDIIKFMFELKAGYQKDFILNTKTLLALALLKDNDGRRVYEHTLLYMPNKTLHTKPVHISDEIPEIAATASVIGFGDVSKYEIKDRLGIEILPLPQIGALNGRKAFRVTTRTDGILPVPEAFKVMKMGA